MRQMPEFTAVTAAEEREYDRQAAACERLIRKGLCVYLVTDGLNTKVGVSNNIIGRLKQLQTGNPNELHIFDRFNFARQEDAYAFESRVHRACAENDLHVLNEWVHSSPLVVKEIAMKLPHRGLVDMH